LAVPDTIDERALNKRDTLNVYQKTENVVSGRNFRLRAIICADAL
jgi:hypothetical protein